MIRRLPGALLPASLGLALAGPPALAEERAALRVLAAASLTEAVEAVAATFEGAPVETSLGSPSALARQVRDGAPADVVLSASAEWMGFLEEAGALAGPAVVFARNRLVCIAPRGSGLAGRGVAGPADLLGRIGSHGRVAIADEGVPAGEYARRALAHLGLSDRFEGRLVGQKDVRAVLHAVEAGEMDAGFVYATDARVGRVEVLFGFAPETHPPIEYLAAVARGAANASDARRFVAHLSGPAARRLLAEAGFDPP